MKRKQNLPKRLGVRHLQTFLLTAFVLFIAYKILTPPKKELARIDAPNGTKTARLQRISYYENHPSYRIDYREANERIWQTLYDLSAYTNLPPEQALPSIDWSPDSTHLSFFMNGTCIWQYDFSQEQGQIPVPKNN